jgi:TRAP-type C4-dicarboxylate transport system permease small subunit
MAALSKWAGRAADVIGGLLFLAVFAVMNLQVAMRYLLDDPIGWSEEFTGIVFAWAFLWAAAWSLSWADHIRFDLIYDSLPQPLQRAVAALVHLAVAGLFAAVLPATIDFILYMRVLKSPILRLPYDIGFACFGLFVAAIALRSAWSFLRLLAPGWRTRL